MFDIGWTEMAVIGAVLLIVVGPKDLPKVLRTMGYWMGKARSMAREFQRSLDQYVKEAELEDVKKSVDKLNVRKTIQNTIDPKGAIKKELTETDKTLRETVKGEAAAAKGNGADHDVDPTTPAPKAIAPAVVAESQPPAASESAGESDEQRKAQAGGAR
jgi:sec-independent protein translocase protein TatB